METALSEADRADRGRRVRRRRGPTAGRGRRRRRRRRGRDGGGRTTLLFSENLACPEHGVSLPEMEPRIFSFNSPHGACETCSGLGLAPGDRPAAGGRRSRAFHRRGGAAALEHNARRSTTSRSSRLSPRSTSWTSTARGGRSRRRCRTCSSTAPRASASTSPTRTVGASSAAT